MNILRHSLIFAAILALAGCGWMNPYNWGKQPQAPTLEPEGGYAAAKKDWRPLIPRLVELEVAPTTTGAIVEATGLAPTQGYFGAALVAENDGKPVDGTITYRFVAAPPAPSSADARHIGGEQTRRVTAAAFINSIRFADTRKVVVIAADGSRQASR